MNRITDENYDSLMVPQFTLGQPEILALSYLSIPRRYGFQNAQTNFAPEWLEFKLGKPLRSRADFLKGPSVDPWSSDVDKFTQLAKWQELTTADCFPRIRAYDSEDFWRQPVKGLLLWPGAGDDQRRWPEHNFAEVVRLLRLKNDISIGGVHEEESIALQLLKELQTRGVQANVTLCEHSNLSRTVRWLRQFRRVLTNDTGIAHLASALGCSVISISPSQHRGRFVLRGKSVLTIFADVPCLRCGGHCIFDKKLWPCVEEIRPERVAQAIDAFKGGEVQIAVETDFFAKPLKVFPSIHSKRAEKEKTFVSELIKAETQRDRWEGLYREAEAQRDTWGELYRQAETQRDRWEGLYREAEAQRDTWGELYRQAETQRDRYLHSLNEFYEYFPGMRGVSLAEACESLPRISIITPSLNQGSFIEETIRSVLEQQYPNFEHIVVDAGSTDQTLEVFKKYPHVRWISEPDKGQAHAINKGILMSTGDIVAYLNSDDVYRLGAFHKIAAVFTEEPNTYIVVGNCDYIDGASQTVGFLKARYESYEGLIRYWGWDKWFCIPQQSVFMRRSLLSEVGLFNPAYEMTMDYDMWLRIASLHSIRVVDQTLAAFRLTANTKTVSRTHEMYLEEIKASRPHWRTLPLQKRVVTSLAAYRHVGHKMLDVSEHYAFTFNEIRLTLKILIIGMRHWPLLILNPRFWLTAVQVLLRQTWFWPVIRSCHRLYLKVLWHLSKKSS
ncbi:MAG: glycosyltransferase [Deltaproteobacteria bacterium]